MHKAIRCSRCNYGSVRGVGSLCRDCEAFLDSQAADQRRQEEAAQRRGKLQHMHPADERTLWFIGDLVLVVVITLVMAVAWAYL